MKYIAFFSLLISLFFAASGVFNWVEYNYLDSGYWKEGDYKDIMTTCILGFAFFFTIAVGLFYFHRQLTGGRGK